MRKIFPIAGILLITLFSLIGCYPGDAPAATSKATTTLQTDFDKLKTEVAAMAGTINGMTPRIASLEARPSGGKDFSSEISTLTTKDNDMNVTLGKLESRIKTLEDWKAGTGGSSGGTIFGSGGSTTTPVTGQVTYQVNPNPIPQIFSGTSDLGSVAYFTMRINNGMNVWQYVKPILTLSVATGFASSYTINDADISYSYGGYVINKNQIQFTPSFNATAAPPVVSIATNSLVAIPVGGGLNGQGEFQIASGQFIDLLITVRLKTNTSAPWTITPSLSNRGI